MMPAHTTHGAAGAAPGWKGTLACGVAGLGIVFALFLSQYAAIVALADRTLGLLASTAIVWLFITAWGVLWIGMAMALVRWSGRSSIP